MGNISGCGNSNGCLSGRFTSGSPIMFSPVVKLTITAKTIRKIITDNEINAIIRYKLRIFSSSEDVSRIFNVSSRLWLSPKDNVCANKSIVHSDDG
jgi:hypothetical protein